MDFFVDTAEIADIKRLKGLGLVDGVTTNPSLIAKSGRPFVDVIAEICDTVDGPISAEVLAVEAKEMIEQGKKLAKISPNVVIKVPLTMDGLFACRALSDEGYKLNVTLCFSACQAILAAKAGATYISPFVGRLDDINVNGLDLIADIRQIYDNYGFGTKVLAASARSLNHIKDCAKIGADVVTAPPSVIEAMSKHVLTDKGLSAFLDDIAKANIEIGA